MSVSPTSQGTIDSKETDISHISSDSKNEADSGICENTFSDTTSKDELDLETDWQYQLPSPPRAFRDVIPATVETSTSNYDGETIVDSVVTSPELFEKLAEVKLAQDELLENDIPSIVSIEDDREMCKLTLENLEKRKSLVYNRELATSLKYAQDEYQEQNKDVTLKKSHVLNELEDAIALQKTSTLLKIGKSEPVRRTSAGEKNLPNFEISTYDPKKKVDIFEDDTIRSNVDVKRNPVDDLNHLVEHLNAKNNKEIQPEDVSNDDVFKKPPAPILHRDKPGFREVRKDSSVPYNIARSESFTTNNVWMPSNPVKRSKSQIGLNKYVEDASNGGDGSLSKSNSMYDVSGLQSIEVSLCHISSHYHTSLLV